MHVLSVFQQLDVNADQRLARAEIAVLASLLERIDKDGDSLFSQAELFSDEADADWVKNQMGRIPASAEMGSGSGSGSAFSGALEPPPEQQPERESERDHGGSAAEGAASLVADSETDLEDDAAFIDGLSELTMMMDKASSLGSLLNQHLSTDDGGSAQSAQHRHGNFGGAHGMGVDRASSDGSGSSIVGSRRQREVEQAKHDVDLEVTLEAEEELRRMRGLR